MAFTRKNKNKNKTKRHKGKTYKGGSIVPNNLPIPPAPKKDGKARRVPTSGFFSRFLGKKTGNNANTTRRGNLDKDEPEFTENKGTVPPKSTFNPIRLPESKSIPKQESSLTTTLNQNVPESPNKSLNFASNETKNVPVSSSNKLGSETPTPVAPATPAPVAPAPKKSSFSVSKLFGYKSKSNPKSTSTSSPSSSSSSRPPVMETKEIAYQRIHDTIEQLKNDTSEQGIQKMVTLFPEIAQQLYPTTPLPTREPLPLVDLLKKKTVIDKEIDYYKIADKSPESSFKLLQTLYNLSTKDI